VCNPPDFVQYPIGVDWHIRRHIWILRLHQAHRKRKRLRRGAGTPGLAEIRHPGNGQPHCNGKAAMAGRSSAARAPRECAAGKVGRTGSDRIRDIVRKRRQTARKIHEPGVNARDRTLQRVKRARLRFGCSFRGARERTRAWTRPSQRGCEYTISLWEPGMEIPGMNGSDPKSWRLSKET
jgi:hypothetical protein